MARRSRSAITRSFATLITTFSWVLPALGVAALACASWGVPDRPLTTLVAQGAPAWAAVALVLTLVSAVRRRTLPCLISAASFLGLCYLVLPKAAGGGLALPRGGSDGAGAGELRVLQLNAWGRNKDFTRLDELLARGEFDVVALQECGDACYDGRQARLAKAGYFSVRFAEGRLALFARGELTAPDTGSAPPVLSADVAYAKGRKARVSVTHLDRPWPLGPEGAHEKQLGIVAARTAAVKVPFVLVGDFNSAPWAPSMRRALAAARLDEARVPGWPPGTWPVVLPSDGTRFPFPVVPIDSVFTKNGFGIVGSEVGPDVGSDHRPLVVILDAP